MNSGYSDVRFTVYMWEFSCLNYSFDVLISRIGNLSLYNWFCCNYFTCCVITCSCMLVLTTQFSIHALWLEFIDKCVLIYTRYLALVLPLIGEFWLSWICTSRSQSLVLMDSLNCLSEMRSGSVDHRRSSRALFFQAPCSSLEFSFLAREHLLYCL